MPKIKVYTGKTIKTGEEKHPVESVEDAYKLVLEFKKSNKDFEVKTNSTDKVSALYYFSEALGIQVEFYLDGEISDITNVFDSFNESFELQDKLEQELKNTK